MEHEVHFLFTIRRPQINGNKEKRPVYFAVKDVVSDKPRLREIEVDMRGGHRERLTRRQQWNYPDSARPFWLRRLALTDVDPKDGRSNDTELRNG